MGLHDILAVEVLNRQPPLQNQHEKCAPVSCYHPCSVLARSRCTSPVRSAWILLSFDISLCFPFHTTFHIYLKPARYKAMCSCPLLLQNSNIKVTWTDPEANQKTSPRLPCVLPRFFRRLLSLPNNMNRNACWKSTWKKTQSHCIHVPECDIETLQDTPNGAGAFFGRSRNREQSNINTRPLLLSSLLHTTHFPRFAKSTQAQSPWLSVLSFSKTANQVSHVPAEKWTTIYQIFFPGSSLNYLLVIQQSSASETLGPWIHVWVLVCQKDFVDDFMSSRQGRQLKTSRERIHGDWVALILQFNAKTARELLDEQTREERAI